ncbi:papain-like cysteine protease family protein [Streptomyces sp. NPDC001678]|uniref:papain-like cysteine protease family protein n=1 Tax=Streptomyces sp. NPDC001678 TaxID=3364599 RepID=UPI00369C5F8D
MLLRVEPPEAAASTAVGGRLVGRVLGAVVERQRAGRWCWAAVAAGVATYYGTECTQEDVARALGRGDDPSAGAGARLDEALAAVGCFSHWSPGRPAWDRLVSELVAGRLVGVQIRWSGGGSHFVLLCGAWDELVHVADPATGAAALPFADFPRAYRDGGVWDGTFWTRPPDSCPT